MRIGSKVGLLVGGLLTAQVATLGASGYLLSTESQRSARLVATQSTQLDSIANLNSAYGDQAAAYRDLVIYGSPGGDIDPTLQQGQFENVKSRYLKASVRPENLLTEAQKVVKDADMLREIAAFEVVHGQVTDLQTAQIEAIRAGTYIPESDVAGTVLDTRAQSILNSALAGAQARAAQAAADAQASNDRLIQLSLIAALAAAGIVTTVSVIVVRRIVRPIQNLTSVAEETSQTLLPRTVATIRRSDNPSEVSQLDEITSGTKNDELTLLASAMNSVQSRAVALAIEQREAELASADTLVNLGRRNQSLLNRTLSYVGQLEREERDPEVLAKLFQLDHLTTRIRRNAESMLVLAGAEQARTHARPVSVNNVIRGALSEIEDYTRVRVGNLDSGAVLGIAAADVSHLLAELLENGTRFSPVDSFVNIDGTVRPDGYLLRITDSGLGMSDEDLALAQQKIAEADEVRASSKLLGLHIVGRLAARRGLQVSLANGSDGGLVAEVFLPVTALAGHNAEVSTEKVAVAGEQPATTPATDAPATEAVAEQAPAAESVPAVAAPAPAPTAPVAEPAPVGEAAAPAAQPTSPVVAPKPAAAAPVAPAVVHAHMTPAPVAPPVVPAPRVHKPAATESGPRRRVRGAQMPDLGPSTAPTVGQHRDPKAAGRQLAGLQSSVARARKEVAGNADQADA